MLLVRQIPIVCSCPNSTDGYVCDCRVAAGLRVRTLFRAPPAAEAAESRALFRSRRG